MSGPLTLIGEAIGAWKQSVDAMADGQSGPAVPATEPSLPAGTPAQEPVGQGVPQPTPPTDGAQPGDMTFEQLQAAMPNASEARLRQYLPYLNQAMREFDITTPQRRAAFLAQVGHESSDFKYMKELASGSAYEGRADLGNTEPGDGRRFKGRGPIQLTGRSNYVAAGDALGIDLVDNPQRAEDPDVAFRTAGWFWDKKNLNDLADEDRFHAITLRVNGGHNGEADRDRRYDEAKAAFGI